MYDFSKYTDRQLKRAIGYERQFAGRVGKERVVSYHKDAINAAIKELRNRGY